MHTSYRQKIYLPQSLTLFRSPTQSHFQFLFLYYNLLGWLLFSIPGSLRMLTNIFSSLIFTALFAYSLKTTPTVPGLSLYVSAIFSFLAAVFLKRHLDKETRDAAAGMVFRTTCLLLFS